MYFIVQRRRRTKDKPTNIAVDGLQRDLLVELAEVEMRRTYVGLCHATMGVSNVHVPAFGVNLAYFSNMKTATKHLGRDHLGSHSRLLHSMVRDSQLQQTHVPSIVPQPGDKLTGKAEAYQAMQARVAVFISHVDMMLAIPTCHGFGDAPLSVRIMHGDAAAFMRSESLFAGGDISSLT